MTLLHPQFSRSDSINGDSVEATVGSTEIDDALVYHGRAGNHPFGAKRQASFPVRALQAVEILIDAGEEEQFAVQWRACS